MFTERNNQISAVEDSHTVPAIKGLRYVRNFISQSEHDYLLQEIDAGLWLDELKRRVRHYGYRYDYRRRNIDLSMKIGDIPKWAEQIARRAQESGLLESMPDQVIINEYLSGQGIAAHIDCEPCFEDGILSLSLGSGCMMTFSHKDDKSLKSNLWLEAGSMLVMREEARYDWLHGINANKTDKVNGKTIKRGRRVSLTFRKVIIKP